MIDTSAKDEPLLTAALRIMHPPRPPRHWVAISITIIAATKLLCLLLAWLGMRLQNGRAWHYFQERRVGTFASVALLFACAYVCYLVFRVLRGGADPFARFWFIHLLAFAYLALDDLLRVHENIDFLVHFLTGSDPKHKVTTHLDDLVLLVYASALIAVWWRFRRRVLNHPWIILTMGLAACGFAAMMVVEFAQYSATIEESIKLITIAIIFCALLSVAMEYRAKETP